MSQSSLSKKEKSDLQTSASLTEDCQLKDETAQQKRKSQVNTPVVIAAGSVAAEAASVATTGAAAANAAAAAIGRASAWIAAARFSHQGPGTKPGDPSGIFGVLMAGESLTPACSKAGGSLELADQPALQGPQ